jgi:hypothetical protein
MSVASEVGAVVSVRHTLAIWHACSAVHHSCLRTLAPCQSPTNAYLHHDKGRPAPGLQHLLQGASVATLVCFTLTPFLSYHHY